jgi:hypothetical protein
LLVGLTVLPQEAGGRKHPVLCGYAPTWKHETIGDLYTAEVLMPSWQGTTAGTIHRALLRPLYPQRWLKLGQNDVLTCHEGDRLVGYANVEEFFGKMHGD